MIDLFLKGGPLMIPLLLGSLLMLTVILERGLLFFKTRFKSDNFNMILEFVKSGDYKSALNIVSSNLSPISSFIQRTIANINEPRDILENELSIYGDNILANLGKHLHLLALIGRIAPMLGLLGTVMGMVDAFHEVASVQGIVEPSLLASGIWSALITTVAGLFVGIPSLIAHSLFESRLNSIAFRMKCYSDELVAIFTRKKNDRV